MNCGAFCCLRELWRSDQVDARALSPAREVIEPINEPQLR